jgi:hypothetical protein
MIGLIISRMFPPDGLGRPSPSRTKNQACARTDGPPAKAGENIMGSIRVVVNGVLEKLLAKWSDAIGL